MLPTTIKLIRGVLDTDATITAKQRDRFIAFIRNGDDVAPEQPTADRILRRGEVAKLLSRSTRGVDMLTRQGLLKKIKLPGRTRCAGFKLSAVNEFIENAST
ncbi:MAG TPA: hypothetical protein VN836_12850 [Verrucomicrobiae bacterium]|nr:hypothetical protein [Verrucomicrobiae bacterium]